MPRHRHHRRISTGNYSITSGIKQKIRPFITVALVIFLLHSACAKIGPLPPSFSVDDAAVTQNTLFAEAIALLKRRITDAGSESETLTADDATKNRSRPSTTIAPKMTTAKRSDSDSNHPPNPPLYPPGDANNGATLLHHHRGGRRHFVDGKSLLPRGPPTSPHLFDDESRLRQEAELEDSLRREFVRISTSRRRFDDDGDVEYMFEKKTYSTFPRQFECFSCMSLSYQDSWEHLQMMYAKPKVFTNRCNDPLLQRNIPTVLCGTVCVTLLEPTVEAGVFLGYKYIRGCEDRILRHGFNQSALRTHRFIFADQQCKILSRAHLFNQPRHNSDPIVHGDVELCTCFGDKCNGASAAADKSSQQLARLTVLLISLLSVVVSLVPMWRRE